MKINIYTITLEDCPSSVTEQAKLNAEYRFQRVLERAFRGPEEVLLAYRAWQNAMESDESELSEDDKALAKRWMDAASKAQQEGFRGLGECEAYFEIRLMR